MDPLAPLDAARLAEVKRDFQTFLKTDVRAAQGAAGLAVRRHARAVPLPACATRSGAFPCCLGGCRTSTASTWAASGQ